MVLNITNPVTSAAFAKPIQTRREVAYTAGSNDSYRKFDGLTKGELAAEMHRLRKSLRGHEKKRANANKELAELDRLLATEDDLVLWAKDFLVFEKPKGGSAASLRQAFEHRQVMSMHEVIAKMRPPNFEYVFEEAEIFRVEHDWFKAIRKAHEFETGSFRLPYETCIFEFQVSKKAVVAMCINNVSEAADNEIVMQIAVESFFGWRLSDNLYRHNGGQWDVLQGGQTIQQDKLEHLVELVGNQIRAACIALDADVAATTLVRESHAGKERDAKEYPEYEFYTINIASRTRAEALQSHSASKGTKRLHFRRGHWRHFTASKTWVRWCLVGNPELGFIDKQYRL